MDPSVVTRAVLNSDLESRVNYMKSFLEFNEDDCEVMKAIRPIAKPLVPDIVASAYEKLLSYECCKIAFFPRKDGAQGTHGTPSDLISRGGCLTIESAQIKLRRNILEKWAMKIFTSDYKDLEIFEFFDRVGIQHTGGARVFSTGNKKPLYVDYIHLAMTLGYITDRMTAAILTLPSSTWPLEKKTRAVRALHKITWIHNELLARHQIGEPLQLPNSPPMAQNACEIDRKNYYNNVFTAGSPASIAFCISPTTETSFDGSCPESSMHSQFSSTSLTSPTLKSTPQSPQTPDSAPSQPLFNGYSSNLASQPSTECEFSNGKYAKTFQTGSPVLSPRRGLSKLKAYSKNFSPV